MSVKICFYIWVFLCWVHKYFYRCYILLVWPFYIIWCPSLFLISVFVLTSILSEKFNEPCFLLVIICLRYLFHHFNFSLCMTLKHIVASLLSFWPLYFFVWTFSQLIFKVISDRYGWLTFWTLAILQFLCSFLLLSSLWFDGFLVGLDLFIFCVSTIVLWFVINMGLIYITF